jgi:hypothetical protein
MIKVVGWLLWCKFAITFDPNARTYTDLALTSVGGDDETLDLLTKTTGVDAALVHQRKVQRLTQAVRA